MRDRDRHGRDLLPSFSIPSPFTPVPHQPLFPYLPPIPPICPCTTPPSAPEIHPTTAPDLPPVCPDLPLVCPHICPALPSLPVPSPASQHICPPPCCPLTRWLTFISSLILPLSLRLEPMSWGQQGCQSPQTCSPPSAPFVAPLMAQAKPWSPMCPLIGPHRPSAAQPFPLPGILTWAASPWDHPLARFLPSCPHWRPHNRRGYSQLLAVRGCEGTGDGPGSVHISLLPAPGQ